MATIRRITNLSIQLDVDEKLIAMQVNIHAEVADSDPKEPPFTKQENVNCLVGSLSDVDKTTITKFIQAAGKIADNQ